MIQSSLESLENRITPDLGRYESRYLPKTLHEAKDYFEKAYVAHAIEKNVWMKDEAGNPLPHGGMYIDQLAKAIGTSRKNASYLVNQKHHLKPLADYYSCEKRTVLPKNIDEVMQYRAIDRVLEQAYAACFSSAAQDLSKYLLPSNKKEETAKEIAAQYVSDFVGQLPKAAQMDFTVNRILDQNLSLAEAKKEFEKQFLAARWREAQFSLQQTAQELGISPRHVRRKIAEHRLTPEQQFYFPLDFLWKRKITQKQLVIADKNSDTPDPTR